MEKKLNLYSLAEGLGLKEIGYMLYGGKINDIEIQLSTKYKDITFFVGDQDNALRFNLDDEF